MAMDADKQYLLNHMNSTAYKVGLGDLLANAAESSRLLYSGWASAAGGDATETIAVPGVVAGDLVQVVPKSGTAYVINAIASTDLITVTFSADPGAVANLMQYFVYRTVA